MNALTSERFCQIVTDVTGTKQTTTNGVAAMTTRPAITMLLVLLGTALASAQTVRAGPKSVLDQTALVGDVDVTLPDPCYPDDEPGEKYSKYFGLKPKKSKFKMINRNGFKYRIDVQAWLDKEIEKSNFYLFNTGTPPLPKNPCSDDGDVSKGFFALAVEDLVNPDTQQKGPHAVIYIPMDLQADTSDLATEFYLVVLTIEKVEATCDGDEYESEERARCHALYKLYKVKADGKPEYEFVSTVQMYIGTILPPRNVGEGAGNNKGGNHPKFHNGVIHGTF
jgi:hypothetical protein